MQNYWNLLFLDQGVDWEDPEFAPLWTHWNYNYEHTTIISKKLPEG